MYKFLLSGCVYSAVSVMAMLEIAMAQDFPAKDEVTSAVIPAAQFTEQMKNAKAADKPAVGSGVSLSGTIANLTLSGSGNDKRILISLAVPAGARSVELEFPSTYLHSESFRKFVGFDSSVTYVGGQDELELRFSNGVILGRVVTSVSHTSSYSYGSSASRTYKSQSKYETPWKPILRKGSQITVQGRVKSLGLRNEIDGCELTDVK